MFIFRDHKAHLEKLGNQDHRDNAVKPVSVERLVNQVNQDHEESQVNLDRQASLDNQVLGEKTENKDLKVCMIIYAKIFFLLYLNDN